MLTRQLVPTINNDSPSHLIHFTRTLCSILYIRDTGTLEGPLTLLWQGLTVSVIERLGFHI